MRTLLLATLVLLAAPAASSAPDKRTEAGALVDGVKTLAMPGVPGNLTVFGHAFPIVAAESGGRPAPLVGATRVQRGRAVLFGHGYFGAALKVGDTARFVANVLRWAARGKKTPRIGLRHRNELAKHLHDEGFVFVNLDGPDWTKRLSKVDAVALHLAQINEHELKVLRQRIQLGLGVASGMPGWGWQQLNPKKKLAVDNMANRLLAPYGLMWGGEYMKKPKSGVLTVKGPAPALTQANAALHALIAQSEGKRTLQRSDAALAVATVTRAIREVPPDDKLLLRQMGKLLKHARDPRFLPSAQTPLTDEQGLGKLLLTLQLQQNDMLPPEKIKAHPAAANFPGAVDKRVSRETRAIAIDTNTHGWHSTGLYAPPGGKLTVRVPPQAVAAGLELRIGAHKDKLWGKAKWSRAPEITVQRPIADERSTHACAFGGHVYVVVPPRSKLGKINVVIQGAVAAPFFVLGDTTKEQWKRYRELPAPWAELETQKVIITVPSEFIRDLDDPEPLMRWWDTVMDGCADLATRPRDRKRPERYVTDVQISAGYMHAGYPIMTHLDAAPRFVNLQRLSTQGDWGMFHEMGHNHQHRDWTFDGTVEVTCNLFSLYLMETVCSKGIGHDAMKPESIRKNRVLYEKGGKQFGLWKSKPFLALIMYHQLRAAFGWEAYKKVFAEYRDLADYERPKDDAQKRDQWLVRMSKTVGRNLGPFFESWGVPVSKQAREAVAKLPAWMPDDGR